MENKLRKEALEELTMLLHQKGYRGKFSLDKGEMFMTGDIRDCLESFLRSYDMGGNPDGCFDVRMNAPYDQSITCDFNLKFDESEGFRIREFNVSNRKTGESKLYRLQNNNQLPGGQTLYTLFPKPKPWDWMKRKFRP